jgi:hypothetical protein
MDFQSKDSGRKNTEFMDSFLNELWIFWKIDDCQCMIANESAFNWELGSCPGIDENYKLHKVSMILSNLHRISHSEFFRNNSGFSTYNSLLLQPIL